MSYFTQAEFFYFDDAEFSAADLDALPSIVEACMLSQDVVGDVLNLISDGKALISIYALDVIGIFSRLAQANGDVSFVIRGMGEAPLDVWMREYRDGKIVQGLGPPANAV